MPVLTSESLIHASPQAVVEAVRLALEPRGLAEPGGGELFAERLATEPVGRETWEYRGISPLPFVAVLWVRDYAGRLSARIVAGTVHQAESIAERDKPPLAVLFPDHAYIVQCPGCEREAVLACACGVIGGVEGIAWMGERCGPCHDRLEAGETVPGLRHWRRLMPDAQNLEAGTTWEMQNDTWCPGTPLTLAPNGDLLVCRRGGPWTNSQPVAEVALWNQPTGNLTAEWRTPEVVINALYLDDGRLVLSMGEANALLLQVPGDHGWTLRLPTLVPSSNALAHDGAALYLGLHEGLLRIDLATGTTSPFPQAVPIKRVNRMACSPDRKSLALVEDAGMVALLDLATGEPTALAETEPYEYHGGIAFTPDGEFLLIVTAFSEVCAYALPELKFLGTIESTRPNDCFKTEVVDNEMVLFDSGGLTRWPLEPLRELLGRWRSGRASG